MTTVARLLARKQKLLRRLQEGPGWHERDEIERRLAEIGNALDSLEGAEAGINITMIALRLKRTVTAVCGQKNPPGQTGPAL
jgi:hypothetical protein